ncbi:MAG: hypothetical protein U0W24_14330 [Bacteroidales bacterium]
MIKKTALTIILMEGLGAGAYTFGGIILIFTAIFLFIEMYLASLICLIPGFLLIAYRCGTSLDLINKEIVHKWGFFNAFIPINRLSITEARAVVIKRHVSKVRTSMRSGPPNYHVEIELPDKKMKVWGFYYHGKSIQIAKELFNSLKVNYYQGSEINY